MIRTASLRSLLLFGGLSLALTAAAGLGGVGCNWMTSGAPRELRQGVVIKCNQPKATLYIDERIVGTLSRPKGLRVGLAPGSYRLVVRLPGYFTRYLQLKISKDRYQKVTVLMRPELD